MLANPPAQKRLSAHRSEYAMRYNTAIVEWSKDYASHRFNMHYYLCKACNAAVQIPVPVRTQDTQVQVVCYDVDTHTRTKSTIQLSQLLTIKSFAEKINNTTSADQLAKIKNKTNPTVWSHLLSAIAKINKTT